MSDGREFGSTLKLRRAQEHIAAAGEAAAAWLSTDAYTIDRRTDATTGVTEALVRLRGQPPPELALLVGDAVHNLRAALDHAMYEAAVRRARGVLAPAIEATIAFPVVSTGDDTKFASEAGQRLKGVSGRVRDVVRQEQPYLWNSAEHPEAYRFHPIWKVNALDSIDKHRRVTVTAAALGTQWWGVPEGVDPRTDPYRADGPVHDGLVLARYTGRDAGVSHHVDRAVAITDGNAGGDTIAGTLATLLQSVAAAVRASARRAPDP
jgi:hypothetical protein